MAVTVSNYQSLADLTLFLKFRDGTTLMLSDVPKIVSLRWPYFRDNWEFIKPGLIAKIANYNEQDYLKSQISALDNFITIQRTVNSNVNPFSDQSVFFKFYGVFDNVEVNSIDLTNEEIIIVDNAIARVSIFNKNDFLRIRNNISAARDTMADQVGLSDATYNAAVGRSSVPQQTTAQIEDMARMQYLQNAIFSCDFILANIASLSTSFVDPFALARVNANNPDFNIDAYKSGKLVRLNYGEDLTLLAARYLGDSNKWIDIAIANGLKPPYIDEVGQALPLVTNGSSNEINIGAVDVHGNPNIDKVYINQVVLLQSLTQNFPEQRTITNIRQIPISGELVIGLSGAHDMNLYKVSDNAYLRVFAPNTINSRFFILIPSMQPLPDARPEEVPYFLAAVSESEKRAKVDLTLGDNGELLLNSTGDVQLSYGLANALQAIKLKMVTQAGTLMRHPEFGLVNVVGTPTQNVSLIKASLIKSIDEQIRLDPRFERLENLDVQYTVNYTGSKSASAFIVRMQVRLAGSSTTVIPISFTVTI
jgi:hypothetical protein